MKNYHTVNPWRNALKETYYDKHRNQSKESKER